MGNPTHFGMRIRDEGHRITRYAVAGAAVIGTAGLLASTTPAAGAHGGDTHVVHIVTRLTSVTTNSAGQGGPGDVTANLWAFDAPGGGASHADISCDVFPNNEQLCHAAFVLPRGQIDAMAAIPVPPPSRFVAAVIGGTGAYEGAQGRVINVITAPGVITRTFEFRIED